jgi:hypothetical protein
MTTTSFELKIRHLRQAIALALVSASVLVPSTAMACMVDLSEGLTEGWAGNASDTAQDAPLFSTPNLDDDYTYQRAWFDYIEACYYGPVSEFDSWQQTWQAPFNEQWNNNQLIWQEELNRYGVACG